MAKLPNETTQVPVPLKHTSVEGNVDGFIASVDVTQQPSVERQSSNGRYVALRRTERDVHTPDVTPLVDDEAVLEDESGRASAGP